MADEFQNTPTDVGSRATVPGGFGQPSAGFNLLHSASGGVGAIALQAVRACYVFLCYCINSDRVFGLLQSESVHLDRFNRWVHSLLSEHGADLYRYKGLLAVSGYEERYIFQGVHMLFTGCRGRKWKEDEKVCCKLVLIGRHLNREELEAGFLATLVKS